MRDRVHDPPRGLIVAVGIIGCLAFGNSERHRVGVHVGHSLDNGGQPNSLSRSDGASFPHSDPRTPAPASRFRTVGHHGATQP